LARPPASERRPPPRETSRKRSTRVRQILSSFSNDRRRRRGLRRWISQNFRNALDQHVDAEVFALVRWRRWVGLRHRELAYRERHFSAFDVAEKVCQPRNVGH